MGQSAVKAPGLTWERRLRRPVLSGLEDRGTPGVAVKCVEIGKNTDGEGSDLGPH